MKGNFVVGPLASSDWAHSLFADTLISIKRSDKIESMRIKRLAGPASAFLSTLACIASMAALSGCFAVSIPKMPEDLHTAKVEYGADAFSKRQLNQYPELGWITDLRYGAFGNVAQSELAIVGTDGAEFAEVGRAPKRTIHFPGRAFERVVLVQAKNGAAPLFLDCGSWISKLRLLGEDGAQLWSYGGMFTGIDGCAAGDLYGNGKLEFAVGLNGGGGLHLFDHNGREIWKKPAGNAWHVEIADADAGAPGAVINSDASGALTVRDGDGAVLARFRPAQYVAWFGLTRWGHESTARHLVVPDRDAIVIVSLDGQRTAALQAPGVGSSPETILSTPVCFSGRECYQATLANYQNWKRSVLYIDNVEGKLAYKETFADQCATAETIPVESQASGASGKNLLIGCGSNVWEYTSQNN